MAPDGFRLVCCLIIAHSARNSPALFSFLCTSTTSKVPTRVSCAKFRFLCAIQQERLARRTNTGWCTPTTSVWSWRWSSRETVTSPCTGKQSCRWHWASLRDRWDGCRVDSTSTFNPTGLTDWCAGDVKVTHFRQWGTMTLDVCVGSHSSRS